MSCDAGVVAPGTTGPSIPVRMAAGRMLAVPAHRAASGVVVTLAVWLWRIGPLATQVLGLS